MHYLLNEQYFCFPSSNDPSYTLHDFVNNKCNDECSLPVIVRISSSNIHQRSIKTLLTKNIPLLLLNTFQFESLLAEYHTSHDGKHQSNKHRLTLTRDKLLAKKTAKYRTMKKISKSLVTVAPTTASAADLTDDNSDDDHFNARTIVRNLNERRSAVAPLCRVPIHYHGFFELLNENDQATEPCHHLSELLITEYHIDENNHRIHTEKWPQAFFLRSTCTAYTKKTLPDDRNLSGSADSCYGSFSDLDANKNLLILNDEKQLLQPGQIIKILNQSCVYRNQTSDEESKIEQSTTHSSATSWLRNRSRFFFSKKKNSPSHMHQNRTTIKPSSTKTTVNMLKASQPYLKCQIERGDIVYISIYESGLFSPIYSKHERLKSKIDSDNFDLSGVFQLKELLLNFRFPISVRLLNNSISLNSIYSPANNNESESSIITSTKFRLLLPYTEDVIFACPLIVPSSLKSQLIVIPIPINSRITIQRCLNMREIAKSKPFFNLIQKCYQIINQYEKEFSYLHFPLVLSATATKHSLKRKQPLFKKRAQSESNIGYYSPDLTKETYRKSCDVFNYNTSDTDDDDDNTNLHHHSWKLIKQNSSKSCNDFNSEENVLQHSSYHSKLKIDKPRKSSRQQEPDPDDENYREVDCIYDYIRSGDVTDDIQKIQIKEQMSNATQNPILSSTQVNASAAAYSTIKNLRRDAVTSLDNDTKIHRFSPKLDRSRLNDDDMSQTYYSARRRHTYDTLPDSTNLKSIIRMKRT